jgi:hypothetical protein
MDIASLRAKLDNIAEELAQLPEQDTVAIEEEEIEEVEQPVEEDHHEKDEDGNVIPHDEIEEEAVEEGFAVGASVAPSEEGPDQAPGKVIAVDGDKVTVKFMDGSTEVFAQDELFALPAGMKMGEEVEEEAVEEAMVEIPVQELADIMQLAGYTDYAQRIEEYANEPEEQYMDAEEQLIGLSGGLNGPKTMHTPASGGDNPMDKEALKTVEENLYKSYKDFLEEAEIKDDEVVAEGKMSPEDELEMLKANVKNPAQSDEAKEKMKARIKELEEMIKKED